ncbi:MAG: FAD-binding protein [Bryobacteraceae bacterium]|nr:FAD-binding protein [Bryobacteraceae bacterium]
MKRLEPATPAELAEALACGQRIHLGGAFTKRLMGGPCREVDIEISTRRLTRIVQYEPADLTISVEAGVKWCELTNLLAKNRQMIPLDPPFAGEATVGGVVAASASGPRRRLYGSVRDAVIGMHFATLDGRLIQSGGMVVKNVAGLDMAKMMIGSMGTLAGIAVVNFKLTPQPEEERTFVFRAHTAEPVFAWLDRILEGVLQPSAIDVLNPAAAARLRFDGWTLLLRAGGNAAVMKRYARELNDFEAVGIDSWTAVQEFTPIYLAEHAAGAVVRASTKLREVRAVMESFNGPAVSRAGSGVTYGYFPQSALASDWMKSQPWPRIVEFAEQFDGDRWPGPGDDFETMRRVKAMFDPQELLNPGRLYGRL